MGCSDGRDKRQVRDVFMCFEVVAACTVVVVVVVVVDVGGVRRRSGRSD